MSQSGVVIYTSGVAANVFITKNTTVLENMLSAHGIAFTKVDISIDDKAKEYMQTNSKASNPKSMPQVFKDGKYIGDFPSLQEANEYGEFKQLFA